MFYYKFSDGTWNDGDFGGVTVRGGIAFICEWDNGSKGKKFAASDDGTLSLYAYGRTLASGTAGKVSGSLSKSITNFSVSPNNGSLNNGRYEVKLSEAEKASCTISADNYQKYIIPQQVIKSVKNELIGADGSITAYLNLDKKDGKPYVSTVYGKINTDDYSYKEITRNSLTIESGKEYSIIVSGCDMGDDAKYYLYQEGGQKLENTTGVFTQEMYSKFSDDGAIYAYVKGSNGTSPAVKLSLKKILTENDAQLKKLIDSGEISLMGNVTEVAMSGSDFLDNAKLDLSVFKVPVDYTIEDNTLKMSIGLKLWNEKKSTKDSSKTATKYKKNWEYSNFVSDFKKLWSNPSKDLTENYTKAKALQKKYDKTTSTVKSRSKSWDFSFLGYAEWEYINGKWFFKEGSASLVGSYQFKYSQQGFVWVVPEYTYFAAKMELGGNGTWSKAGPSDLYPIQFDLSVNANPELKVGGGVGFENLASAGLWGTASLPSTFSFTKKHLTVDVSGKFGYEAKFLYIFGTEKTLLEGKINLVDKYWSTAKSDSVSGKQSVLSTDHIQSEGVKSEDVPITIEDRSYAKSTSDWLGGRFLQGDVVQSDSTADGVTFQSLQTSIFEGYVQSHAFSIFHLRQEDEDVVFPSACPR